MLPECALRNAARSRFFFKIGSQKLQCQDPFTPTADASYLVGQAPLLVHTIPVVAVANSTITVLPAVVRARCIAVAIGGAKHRISAFLSVVASIRSYGCSAALRLRFRPRFLLRRRCFLGCSQGSTVVVVVPVFGLVVPVQVVTELQFAS